MKLDQVTAETLEMVKKAESSGLLVATGVQGVDLSGLVALVPVNVPARNNTSAFPRTIAGQGSQTAVWRSLLNINAKQSDAAVGLDFAGSLTKFSEQDCFAPYKPLAKAGRVTLDAVAVARNYADALAVAELQTLNQLFIDQDLHIINSQNWSLATEAELGKPTLVANITGGTLKKGVKWEAAYAARSGANYFIGGSTESSEVATAVETITNETDSVTATIPKAVKGAVAYDWYFGEEGKELFYYTTTTTGSVTFTTLLVAPKALPKLPLLSATVCSKTRKLLTERAVKDTSFSSKWYNGVIASTLGDYGETGPVKPGKGTASGAVFLDNGGAAITASGSSIPLLDEINDEVWANVQLSPTAYMVNSQQGDEISKLILESSASTTFLPPTDADARTNLAGGGYIGRYINKAAGGVPVQIEVHPRVAPGTIIARTDRVPFPGSNIGSVYEVRCQYDTMRFDYAANYEPAVEGGGPRYDFEIRSMETLVNRAPVAQAIVANVK
jgi:hypothetical protein